MFRIKIAMIVGGLAMAFFGVQEFRMSQVAKVEPTPISCADLAAKGPGDNAHIVLKDFLMCEQSFVYESKKNNPNWNKVWVPAVPVNGDYHKEIQALLTPEGKLSGPLPTPKDIKVIIKSGKITNEAELTALGGQETMTGLVTNQIESLGTKEREILASSYPGIDFTKCWIVDHDRKPAGMGQIGGLVGGGLLLTILGGLWMFGGSRARA